MLADLITKIERLANQAAKGEIIGDPSNPRRGWLTQNGTKEEISLARPDVHSLHSTLPSFARIISEKGNNQTEIFVSPAKAVAELVGFERRDSATMPLNATERFKKAANLAMEPEYMVPRDLWRLLVHTFHDCNVPVGLVKALTTLKFSNQGTGGRSAGHGVDQMGASVNRAVDNAEEIPQRFGLKIPAFHGDGLDDIIADVEFSVEVDAEREQIRLGVYPDSLHAATMFAVRQVTNRIAEAINLPESDGNLIIPVYAGEPWS